MRYLIHIVVILLGLGLLASCSEDRRSQRRIKGEWNVDRIETFEYKILKGLDIDSLVSSRAVINDGKLTFKDNNTGSFTGNYNTVPLFPKSFKWSVNDGVLSALNREQSYATPFFLQFLNTTYTQVALTNLYFEARGDDTYKFQVILYISEL